MGPPIERRCQVSNPLGIGVIKRNPPKFINFRPAEEPMKGFSRPMPFLAQKFRSQSVSNSKRRCKKTWCRCHLYNSAFTLLNALCLQCFNPSGTQSQWKDLVGQCPFLHRNSGPNQYPIPRGVVKRLSVGVTCTTLHSPSTHPGRRANERI